MAARREQLIVSWSLIEKRLMDAVEDYSGSVAPTTMVDILVVERLPRSENLEVSLRHATGRGSNIFQLDTSERPNHFVASRRRWLESQGRNGARQENGQKEWYDLQYQGARAKAPPCPDSTSQTLLLSEARRQLEKKKTTGSLMMEDLRRRGIASETLAKEMLRYCGNSDDVKVAFTRLQERSEVPVQIGISIQQVSQQAMNENGQKIFEVFWQEEKLCVTSWARWEAQRKGLVDLERRCQDTSRELQMLNKRQ